MQTQPIKRYRDDEVARLFAKAGRVETRMSFVYLRATGWCAMTWVEYMRLGRLLRNEETFTKIVDYLKPEFLVNLFRPYVPGLWVGDP